MIKLAIVEATLVPIANSFLVSRKCSASKSKLLHDTIGIIEPGLTAV